MGANVEEYLRLMEEFGAVQLLYLKLGHEISALARELGEVHRRMTKQEHKEARRVLEEQWEAAKKGKAP